jgi:hypothetical protein
LFAVLFELDIPESAFCAAIYWVVGALIGVPTEFVVSWLWELVLR